MGTPLSLSPGASITQKKGKQPAGDLESPMSLSFSILMCWEKVEKIPIMHCCVRMDEKRNYNNCRVIIFIKEVKVYIYSVLQKHFVADFQVSLKLLVNNNIF